MDLENIKPIMELMDLSGKTAIVTGGALGIGEAVSYRLAEAGASVMIADINLESAETAAKMINGKGWKAKAIKADVSNKSEVDNVVKATVDAFGGVDILVNNAGIYPMVPMMDLTEETWDRVLDINLKGSFFFAQSVAKAMIDSDKGGKIINIASIDAFLPSGNLVHYDSSKGGVRMMTKAMAKDLAPNKIQVNAIAPGSITTVGTEAITNAASEQMAAMGMTGEQMLQAFLARVPLARMGVPDDIGKVVLFLASGLSDYMTGHIVVVDGGYLSD